MRLIHSHRQAGLFRFANILLLPAMLFANTVFAEGSEPRTIRITLGDYHFSPAQLTLTAGQPVILELANTDGFTPHNFSLQDKAGGLDIDVNISAGQVIKIPLTPQVSGNYDYYCNKKLPLLKSHRMRGMKGTLLVTTPGSE